MTTIIAPTKPKRRRARRRKPANVAMNQQQPKKVELPTIKPAHQTVRVERVRPDVQLISRDAYWSDFQERMKLHNYEVAEALDDLKVAVTFTNRMAKNLYDKIVEVAP